MYINNILYIIMRKYIYLSLTSLTVATFVALFLRSAFAASPTMCHFGDSTCLNDISYFCQRDFPPENSSLANKFWVALGSCQAAGCSVGNAKCDSDGYYYICASDSFNPTNKYWTRYGRCVSANCSEGQQRCVTSDGVNVMQACYKAQPNAITYWVTVGLCERTCTATESPYGGNLLCGSDGYYRMCNKDIVSNQNWWMKLGSCSYDSLSDLPGSSSSSSRSASSSSHASSSSSSRSSNSSSSSSSSALSASNSSNSSSSIDSCPKKKLGDADCDGLVDGHDFNIWKCEYLGGGMCSGTIDGVMVRSDHWANFNPTNDGLVDLYDFEVWREQANIGPICPPGGC